MKIVLSFYRSEN